MTENEKMEAIEQALKPIEAIADLLTQLRDDDSTARHGTLNTIGFTILDNVNTIQRIIRDK